MISVTSPMRRMPPRMTAAVMIASTTPVICGDTPKLARRLSATELAWTMFPIPNAASATSAAKAVPSQGSPSLRSVYIAPPRHTPLASRSR
jgi:hypothetical protein